MAVQSDIPPRTWTPTETVAVDRTPDHDDAVSSTVWFGPFVPDGLEREFMAFLGTRCGVAVLTWPRDREPGEHLARAGLPRLFLVPSGEASPPVTPLQDWLPLSSSQVEIHNRLLALTRSAREQRARAGRPTLDDRGRLHVGAASVWIPMVDRPLVVSLVAHFGNPVATTDVAAASAEGRAPLSVRFWHLSQRVNALGLQIVVAPGDTAMLCRCAAGAVR
jgi:hypothetical protein